MAPILFARPGRVFLIEFIKLLPLHLEVDSPVLLQFTGRCAVGRILMVLKHFPAKLLNFGAGDSYTMKVRTAMLENDTLSIQCRSVTTILKNGDRKNIERNKTHLQTLFGCCSLVNLDPLPSSGR